MTPVRIVTTPAGCQAVAREAMAASRIAVDLESDGLFAYRAQVCTVQLAWDDQVAVVDSIATDLTPLAEMLSERGPVKVVHDTAFDALLLAERGIPLGNVHDTAILARMLGRAQTGLSSVLLLELGLTVSKAMQHHDWRKRPLDDAMLAYLAGDVVHLGALDDRLFTEALQRGIDEAVLCETRYRISCAALAVKTPPRPPYMRLRGIEKLHGPELAVARRLAELREREAARRDVPPHRVISADAVVAVAQARPKTNAEAARIRGVPAGMAFELARAVVAGLADGAIPDDERRAMERPRVDREVAKARRAREGRLSAWRKVEAKRREVDEQVVLPGHCLKAIAEMSPTQLSELADVAGLGDFRVRRDGEAILAALALDATPEGDPDAESPGEVEP